MSLNRTRRGSSGKSRRRKFEEARRAREDGDGRTGEDPTTVVGFGKYCGRACEWVHNQDRQYCEWVGRQESSNRALLKENRRKKEMEENEKRKEEEKRREEERKQAEAKEEERRAIEDMRDVLTRVRTNTMAMAAAEVSKTTETKTDAMPEAETDVAAVARKVTTAAAEQKVKVADKDDEESAKDGAGWKRGKSVQEMLGVLERSAVEQEVEFRRSVVARDRRCQAGETESNGVGHDVTGMSSPGSRWIGGNRWRRVR